MNGYELTNNFAPAIPKAVNENFSREQSQKKKRERIRMFTVNQIRISTEYIKNRLIFEDEVDLSEYKNELYPVILSVNFVDLYEDYLSFYRTSYKGNKNLSLNLAESISFNEGTNQDLISRKKFTAGLNLVVKQTKNINLQKSKGKKLRLFGVSFRFEIKTGVG